MASLTPIEVKPGGQFGFEKTLYGPARDWHCADAVPAAKEGDDTEQGEGDGTAAPAEDSNRPDSLDHLDSLNPSKRFPFPKEGRNVEPLNRTAFAQRWQAPAGIPGSRPVRGRATTRGMALEVSRRALIFHPWNEMTRKRRAAEAARLPDSEFRTT